MTVAGGRWECSAWARWLPRVVAGAILASAMIASAPPVSGPDDRPRFLRPLVITAGGAVALWALRRGSVLRRHVTLDERGLTVGIGARERTLELRDVTTIRLRWPFEGAMHWVPTVAIGDVFEQSWELPTVLIGGPDWLERFLNLCDREELRTWAEARGVRHAMERSGWFVPAAYVGSAVLIVGAILVYVR